ERAARSSVRANVRRVHEIPEGKVRQLFRQADRIEGVTSGPVHGADLNGTLLEAPQRILAMIENHPAKRVIHAIIEVVADLAVTKGFADDLRARGSRGRDQETPRFRQNLQWGRKEPIELHIDRLRQGPERRDGVVIMGRKTAADIKQLEI